jgi:hypothetical protein
MILLLLLPPEKYKVRLGWIDIHKTSYELLTATVWVGLSYDVSAAYLG